MSSIPHGKSTSIPAATKLVDGGPLARPRSNKGIKALDREEERDHCFRKVVKDIDSKRKDMKICPPQSDANEGGFLPNPMPPWTLADGGLIQEKRGAILRGHSDVGVGELKRSVSERILVSEHGEGMEARIRLACGPVAGMEVQLRSTAGGIDAAILKQPDVSRISASSVVQEMAIRLRSKGHMVRLTEGTPQRKDRQKEEDKNSSGQ